MPLTKFKQGEVRKSKISTRKSFKVKQATLYVN